MKQEPLYMFIKKIPFIAMVFLCMPCQAQYQEKNEVSIFVGGGYSPLLYRLNNVAGSRFTPGYGGSTGLGYMFFFNDFFSVGTGAETGWYNSKVTVEQFSDRYSSFDGEENFEFRYTVNEYAEKQNLWTIQIPLLFQFQFPLLYDEHLTYIALGGRIGFPLKATYQSTSVSYETSAYYPQYGVLLETPASQGLGSFLNPTHKDELRFRHPLYMLSAEAGMKWMIANNFSLYTGVYCDCSLADIYQNRQYDSFLKYSVNEPTAWSNLSILQSRYSQNNVLDSFTGKILPATLGLKIRLSFRIPDRNCCY